MISLEQEIDNYYKLNEDKIEKLDMEILSKTKNLIVTNLLFIGKDNISLDKKITIGIYGYDDKDLSEEEAKLCKYNIDIRNLIVGS